MTIIPFVLTAPHLAALEYAEVGNLFRCTLGWRGRNTATMRHSIVMKLKELGLVTTEYRQRQAVEACVATDDGRFMLAVARRNRSSRPRPVIQHTEEFLV